MQRPRELKLLRQSLARGLVQPGILSEQLSKRLDALRERLREVLLAGPDPTEKVALLLGLLEPLSLIDLLVARDQPRVACNRPPRRAGLRRHRGTLRDPCGASRRSCRHRRRDNLHRRGLALNPPANRLTALLETRWPPRRAGRLARHGGRYCPTGTETPTGARPGAHTKPSRVVAGPPLPLSMGSSRSWRANSSNGLGQRSPNQRSAGGASFTA